MKKSIGKYEKIRYNVCCKQYAIGLEISMNKITIKGYAKINLVLDVVGRLDNGYHLLRSIMQQIDIFDVITIEKIPSGIHFTTNSTAIPVDESNLAYRAAQMILQKYHIEEGVSIHLEKRIPVAAGLAGGSADAAAVFKGINDLFELHLTLQELQEMGVKLGADIPFCISGKSALAEGIGEQLTQLSVIPTMYVVIAKPPIDVSTQYVYQHLDREHLTHPDTDGMIKALANRDYMEVTRRLGNVLESVTTQEYSIIGQLKQAMLENGADGALMSGSGPTVFGLFTSMELAKEAENRLQTQFPEVFIRAAGCITE